MGDTLGERLIRWLVEHDDRDAVASKLRTGIALVGVGLLAALL